MHEPTPSNTAPAALAPLIAGRGVQMLRALSWLMIAGIAVTNGQEYFSKGSFHAPLMVPALIGLSLTLWLIKRQRIGDAIQMFLWTMLVASVISALFVAGMYTPVVALMPVVAMAGGLMLSRRGAGAVFAAIVLAVVVIAWLHGNDRLPVAVHMRAPAFVALTIVFASAFGLVLGRETMNSLQAHYGRTVALSGELRQANAELEARVATRTQELSETLERLKQTQDDLIQSEKLASLGSMVAGISHELNTPIGNTVTIATTLEARANELKAAFAANTLKRAELDDGLTALAEMARLLDRSAERAATLIASFKQVAVDQVSERRRRFDLREVVEENLTALRPSLSKKPWVIENHIAPGIECDSYPGPLGQVLTNLIQNAALHAFEGRNEGRIDISARNENGRLELTVEDDGVGMTTATQLRAFEPFFTTKLGRGGSGLGLAICNRIVSTILAGEIRVQSVSDGGTRFVIRMPQRTPGAL